MKKIFLVGILLSALSNIAVAQKGNATYPANLSGYAYTGPVTAAKLPAVTNRALTGKVQVGIKLTDAPLVVAVGVNAKQTGITMTAAQQIAYLAQLKQKQDAVMEIGRASCRERV